VNNQTDEDSDLMRFGHTVTLINKQQAILFGGARGTSGNYTICDDAYLFNINEKMWLKLNPTGTIPCARAAHASTSAENNRLVIFGGAVGGGGLATDDLHLLDLTDGEEKCKWSILNCSGTSPGKRYGHAMVYAKPYIAVFGGNLGNKITNDIWVINIDETKLEWKKLEPTSDLPPPRMYHCAAVCKYGGAAGMIVIFGGRSDGSSALNDTWGLRKHRNGSWDWVNAPYRNNVVPLKRFQHTMAFF
jgi:hypothetical protein